MYRGVVAGAVVVALAAGLGFLYLGVGSAPEGASEPREESDPAAKDRIAEEAAMAVIAAHGRAVDAGAGRPAATDEPPTQAPPGFVPAPPLAHEPAPPPGYEFVSRHEVKRGPMTAADIDRTPTTTPAWMAGESDLVAQAAASGRDWTFGWVKLAEDAGVGELGPALAEEGGAVLGQYGDLVRVRLPGDAARLRAIAATAPVAGIGTWPAARKVTGPLAERVPADGRERVPVWITLMDDDPDRRWRTALEGLGAQVGRFDPALRVYAATLPFGALAHVADADYVLAVEAIGRLEPALELATATVGADAVRTYDQATSLFTGVGGASVPVGVMDTGLNLNHPDLSSNRRSICGTNVSDQTREHDQDLWFDVTQHGSAMAGVVLGNGTSYPSGAGIAPLVQDIRFTKVVAGGRRGSSLGLGRALDWFAKPTECGEGVARKVLAINASVRVSWSSWDGRSFIERKIDASASAARQLFVAAAGNDGERAFSALAGSKNALSVGSTDHSGITAGSSSRGPTFDGRLLPKVVAPGTGVRTTQGRGGVGYVSASGTSVSSAAVAGVAALVMDAVPGLREEPAALRAHLMATAIKPDAFLGDPEAFPSHNTGGPGRLQNIYGLGKVSARTAVLNRNGDDGWTGGAVAFDVDPGSHAYHDIVVPPGSDRLDVVLTWDEPSTEQIANSVLHDLDLWVDRHASCGARAKCGQHSSRSRIDNVEWVIVRNPEPGIYRVKAVPNRTYGSPPRGGMAWQVIRGNSTPTLAIVAGSDHVAASPAEPFEVAVKVSANGYVAAGTMLRVDCRGEVGSDICHDLALVNTESSHAPREDGTPLNLRRFSGTEFALGEIAPNEQQTVTLQLKRRVEGTFRLHFTATGWNARAGSTSVGVVVGDPAAAVPAPTLAPANDDFSSAIPLEGTGGETSFDLQLATFEATEPRLRAVATQRPFRPRSIWYTWTAPESGLTRLTVAQTLPDDYADNVVVAVYEGDTPTALHPVGVPKHGGGITFFAYAGTTYRIALGLADWGLVGNLPNAAGTGSDRRQRSTPTMTLSWGPASRPSNDDYVLAESISGESGVAKGNNQSATTEPHELMGFAPPRPPSSAAVLGPSKVASVWYRWTAPSSGDWRFSTNRQRLVVGVYAGATMAQARLISGVPGREAVFPARAGEEYRVSVALPDAYSSGSDFALSWSRGERTEPGNDDLAAPMPLEDRTQFTLDMDPLTVEAGEPAESGARTAWFAWAPPEDGRYTAVLRPGRWWDPTTADAPLSLSAFEGDDISTLRLRAVHDARTTIRTLIAFDAQSAMPYRIALGLPRDSAETPIGRHNLVLEVGETPANDDLVNAQALSGVRGSVAGSNTFATDEPNERSGGDLGIQSVWYTYQAEESGWMRFGNLEQGLKFVVYTRGEDGDLEVVAKSRKVVSAYPRYASHVTFYAEAGVQYIIRAATYGYDSDRSGSPFPGDFELTWAPANPPSRLRYVQAINDRWGLFPFKEVNIDPFDLGRVGDMVVSGDGTEYYLASDLGLMVFERDPESGILAHLETMQDHPVGAEEHLYWDDGGSALLVASCDGWRKFTPRDGGGLQYAGDVAGAPCPEDRLMLHGPFVHNVASPWVIETFKFGADRDSLDFVGHKLIAGVGRVVMTADGRNMYALSGDGPDTQLIALERDTDTAELTIEVIIADGSVTGDGVEVEGLRNVAAMAVHDSHLFLSVGSGGTDTLAFDLADRSNPVSLGVLPGFQSFRFGSSRCSLANAWSTATAVDVFCLNFNQYYVVQVEPDGSVVPADYSRLVGIFGFNDAFNNRLPWIAAMSAITVSPDGRHLYLAGTSRSRIDSSSNELHVFERVVGNGESHAEEDDAE